jgi:hypothetical protein
MLLPISIPQRSLARFPLFRDRSHFFLGTRSTVLLLCQTTFHALCYVYFCRDENLGLSEMRCLIIRDEMFDYPNFFQPLFIRLSLENIGAMRIGVRISG